MRLRPVATKNAFVAYITTLVSVVCGLSSLTGHTNNRGGLALNTISNPSFKANGTAAKLKAIAKFSHLSDLDASVHHQFSTTGSNLSGFAEANDREWLCPVQIGTPGQTVYLDLDTGSGDLWVFSHEASPSSKTKLGSRQVYDPSNSTTSRHANLTTWSISYGDGSFASGKVYSDAVKIGDIMLSNATVEVASTYSSNLVTNDAPLSGLMGLAINLSTTCEPSMPNIISQLSEEGIEHIAVDLQYHANGTFIFGEPDPTLYTGAMSYQPVVPAKNYWWIAITAIRFGNSNITKVHSWDAIVDTGTSLFLGPSDIVKGYWATVKSATYSAADEAYIFLCNETLPDFHFGFADDWSEFTVPGVFTNYSVAPEAGAPWCYGGIQDSGMSFSIIGDVFLKAVYVDFNIANQSVGFASKELHF